MLPPQYGGVKAAYAGTVSEIRGHQLGPAGADVAPCYACKEEETCSSE